MNDREIKKHQKKHGAEGNERRTAAEWLSLKLDIPADLADGMRIELRGRNTLLIHGCCGILTYSPHEMKFSLTDGELCVRGTRLVCHSYLAGAVGVEGRIDALAFAESFVDSNADDSGRKEELC